MAELESLEIKIEATASSASAKIESLSKSVNKLESSMQKIKKFNTSFQAPTKNISGGKNSFSDAVKKLSQGLQTLDSGLKKTSNGFLNFSNNLKKADKSSKTLSSSLTNLRSKMLLVTRGLSGVWNSVESAMDYMEVVNYFDAAFGQVADKAVSQWEEMGYDSAEAYYNSFGERAQQLSAKMSGFTISDTGLLESTRQTSLGINPSTLMNYQAMFAQMSSSMGVASETALQLSDALTMIGADLASVKNMDFEKVWTDMASGLAGMSRTLDKYGVNIRNVNLQEKLHELGINANIQALNQNDKALLRTIILLDSTRYAWADLADTLNAPANQFRLLRANIETLSRTIGAIFLPIVSKILPYINGLVIAVQRLFSWIAKLMGIDLSGITNSTGSGGEGIGDLLEDTEDLGTGLDDATDSAKKLKRQLQGFDSLNVLSSQEDTKTSGLNVGGISGLLDDAFLDAFSEYQKVWDEAFDRLENRAEEIADSIEKMAKHIFEPIRKAWKTRGKYIFDGWKKALKEIGNLTVSIGKDLDTVWQQDETVEIFEDIFTIIGNIGYSVGFITEQFEKAWSSNDTGLHILENIRDIIGIVVETFREMSYQTAVWAQNLDFENLLDSFESFTGKLGESGGLVESVSGILSDFYTQVLLPLGKWAIEEGLPNFINTVQDIIDEIDWELLRTRLSDFWTELEPFAKTVGQGLIDFIGNVGLKLADFVNSEEFGNFLDKVSEWLDDVTAEDVKNTFEAVVNALIALKAAIIGFQAISSTLTILSTIKGFLAFFGVGGAGATVATTMAKASAAVGTLSTKLSNLVVTLRTLGLSGILSKLNSGALGTGGLLLGFQGIEINNKNKKLAEEMNNAPKYEDYDFGDPAQRKQFNEDLAEHKERLDAIVNSQYDTTSFDNLISKLSGNEIDKESIKSNFLAIGQNTALGITEGIESVDFSGSAKTIFEKANSSLCEEFGINSPAEKMKPIGKNILLGVVEGFTGAFDSIATAIENLKAVFQNKFTAIKTTVLNIVSNIVSVIVSKINYALSMFGLLENIKMPVLNAGNKVLISVAGKMPGFASGGYVPASYSMFMAGENGVPELMGTVGGRTAVAGGAEITGIRDEIRSTANEEIMLLRQQNSLLQAILEKEGLSSGTLFQAVRSEYNAEARRQGAQTVPVWG